VQVQGVPGREGQRDGQDLVDCQSGLQPQQDLQVQACYKTGMLAEHICNFQLHIHILLYVYVLYKHSNK
jgi:hypothetical protein